MKAYLYYQLYICTLCLWMLLEKRKISGSWIRRTRERSQRRDNAELTLSFQDLLFIMLQWLCLVELGDWELDSYVCDLHELYLHQILNKLLNQIFYSFWEWLRDNLKNLESYHTSPEGSSSLSKFIEAKWSEGACDFKNIQFQTSVDCVPVSFFVSRFKFSAAGWASDEGRGWAWV